MKGVKKTLALVLALVLILSLSVSAIAAEPDDEKIVILHTNDVHCSIDRVESEEFIELHYRVLNQDGAIALNKGYVKAKKI